MESQVPSKQEVKSFAGRLRTKLHEVGGDVLRAGEFGDIFGDASNRLGFVAINLAQNEKLDAIRWTWESLEELSKLPSDLYAQVPKPPSSWPGSVADPTFKYEEPFEDQESPANGGSTNGSGGARVVDGVVDGSASGAGVSANQGITLTNAAIVFGGSLALVVLASSVSSG